MFKQICHFIINFMIYVFLSRFFVVVIYLLFPPNLLGWWGANIFTFRMYGFVIHESMVKEETFGEYGKFGEEKQAEEKPHHLLTDKAAYWLRLVLTQTCIDTDLYWPYYWHRLVLTQTCSYWPCYWHRLLLLWICSATCVTSFSMDCSTCL